MLTIKSEYHALNLLLHFATEFFSSPWNFPNSHGRAFPQPSQACQSLESFPTHRAANSS